MIRIPNFLRELIESEAYANNQHSDHQVTNEKVSYYMNLLYPGEMHQDATGKFVPPEYDMTLDQFNAAQKQIDADFEEAKEEAENDVMDQYGEYFHNLGISFDIDDYVVSGESIPVKVLYSAENITVRNLETYDLDIPDFEKINKMWVWYGESSENTCDDCASRNGQLYLNEDDVPECPVHPNCRCWVEEIEMDEDGNVLNRRRHSGAPLSPLSEEELQENDTNSETNQTEVSNEMTEDEKFEVAFERLREPEGGYTDGSNQVSDEPTNMGIKQSTLENFNNKYPEKNFPVNVRDITRDQARDIYRNEYWDNTRIPQIENERIRNAVFDMRVMSGASIPTRTIQSTINQFMGTNIPTNGNLGPQTVQALNSIPVNQINDFMNSLIENRMDSLRTMRNWPTAQGGWTTRTSAY